MRFQLIALMLFASALGIGVAVYLRSLLDTYLKRVVCIETARELEEFKQVVKTAMYASLGQMVFLFFPVVVYCIGLVGDELFLVDVLFVVIPSGVNLLLVVQVKRLESQAQSVSVDSQELLQEFIHVVDTWKKQSLPKW